jgi:hypothetical protein
MKTFRLEKTKSSPEVVLDPAGIVKLRGRSILENSAEFFEPVIEWIDNYVQNPADLTCVDVDLEYFNSATAKFIITLVQRVSRVGLKNRRYKVNWYYEEGDEDILERGEYISSVLEADFNFIKIR